jgi:hypothetical protein
VTCGEAVVMLNEGRIVMAEFRPEELFEARGKYQDSDPCFVWLEL